MKQYSVLFADDDHDFREKNTVALTAAGFKVTEAESAAQAHDIFASQSFDIAVINLVMERPDSGFTLAYQMKKLHPETPVVIVSAVNGEMGIHFGVDTPAERSWIKADAFLNKPLRYEQLESTIKRLLGCEESHHHH